METAKKSPLLQIAVCLLIALAVVVGTAAWLRLDPWGQRGSGLPPSFDYSLDQYEKIDPAMLHYRQTAKIPLAISEARGIAVGPEDRIFVAGDKAVAVFATDGRKLDEIALRHEPYCLAVGNAEHAFPGRLYVGLIDRVETFDPQGRPLAVWDRPAERVRLTSIALAEEEVFVADARGPVVWRYRPDGKLIGPIGRRDPAVEGSGFIVPSPYFDVAMAPDGLLRVVNPGRLRVEAYTVDGHRELYWGRSGPAVREFCGCCGPANIAILPDGGVVTAEKGIPRVKLYQASGEFDCVVVGPDVLAPNLKTFIETRDQRQPHPADLAVDSRARILVLDRAANCVRVFQHR
jgi:hypothetical protein